MYQWNMIISFAVLLTTISLGLCATDTQKTTPPPIEQTHQRENEVVINELQTLAQYEIDGSSLLTQAIEHLKDNSIKEKLAAFNKECQGFIQELSDIIRKRGGQPPKTKDLKGYFMQGYASIRGLTSDQGVLKALDTNIKLVVKVYENALDKFPPDLKPVIRRFYDGVVKHRDYIESKIS